MAVYGSAAEVDSDPTPDYILSWCSRLVYQLAVKPAESGLEDCVAEIEMKKIRSNENSTLPRYESKHSI